MTNIPSFGDDNLPLSELEKKLADFLVQTQERHEQHLHEYSRNLHMEGAISFLKGSQDHILERFNYTEGRIKTLKMKAVRVLLIDSTIKEFDGRIRMLEPPFIHESVMQEPVIIDLITEVKSLAELCKSILTKHKNSSN